MLLFLRALILAPLITVSVILLPSPVLASDESTSEEQLAQSIEWKQGPCVGELGNLAQISVPSGLMFADAEGARKFMEVTQNPPSGNELGIIIPATLTDKDTWFVIFQFRREGYIKDTDRDKLDPDVLLKSVRDGTAVANEERIKRGWAAVEVVGWDRPPFYDLRTNNLTWAIRGRAQGADNVNYCTRTLGREGVMMADLVLSPDRLSTTIPAFENLMAGFHYNQGHRYAEFRQGDKIAAYGLTALVAGGAGAVAAKSGLLAKSWKLLAALFLGVVALLRNLWARMTGKRDAL